MLKIKALNRESSSDEDAPVIQREAQEEIALELYNKALCLQNEKDFSEAESVLSKLIEENIPLLENNGGLPKSMSNLKYSCHMNIGNIYLKLNRVNEALEKYLLASELDGTDVTLWHKIGVLSLDQNKFHQSAYAFEKGLECSESHWPCLDKLISVLYAIRDTVSCLEYIGKALMLDPDYSKGLVLRKQIYRNNPATKEYYKLYNPESVWEPPLDVPIDEEDEKSFLEEAQTLCDKVSAVEKSFESKPLQTIALPKTLNDFTWLCLTETIIFIHQYLADHEMSHFTMIDMKKCMSQVEDTSVFKFPQSDQVEDPKSVDDKVADNKTPQVIGEAASHEEKMETDQILERRISQNSETNTTEVQEITPVQTDNDEEQNMEQETEEQDEVVEPRERGRPKGSKRKRDVVSDLQIWSWYSRRKLSKKAKDKDFTVEDALERVIPKDLLPYRIDPEKFTNFEDSMNTMDLYHMYVENYNVNNYLSPIHSPKSVNYEQYFGTDRETEDVREFWMKSREYYDVIVLIKDLVFHLSKLWHHKWPKELVPLYIKAYNMFREHCDPPQVYCGGHSFEELRKDALAAILSGELAFFSCDTKDPLPPTLLGNLRLISGWEDEWKEEYPSFFIRVYWLQAHLFRKENNNDLAVTALQLIQDAIEEKETSTKEKYMLSLPNCFKYGLINIDITKKIFKHLEMINSLSTVENLFNSEKYKEAADILKDTFNGGPCPQVGRMGRPAQLGILMHSLWFMDKGQCFIWTEQSLNEAFEQHLKFSKDQDKWEKVLEKCLAILFEIIKQDTICVVDFLQEDNRARLVQNLSKIISRQLSSDSSKLSFSCVTPWILLHFVLLREEQRAYAKQRNLRGKREKSENNGEIEEPLDNNIPPSLSILFSAHEFLGPKGLCMANTGELLHFIIDTILDKLDTPIFERIRSSLEVHVEQAMFCLYQHPSKKNKVSRHLADHNVDPLPLTWERACQLFEFYGPEHLPEFNSYKNASISADLEQLFKRIIALVPPANALQHHLPKVMDYIHGKTDKMWEAVDFPRKVKAIYFLIGDFYFKDRDFGKCIKFFQMDLCINPERLDSWACLGLSYAAQLDTKLNHCEKFKSEMEFLDKAKYASICFKVALDICPDPLTLWIECGSFQYNVHSYCSRVMKFESENLSMERFEFLENQKNSYLDSSGNSFEKAIAIYELEDTNEADERWLQYYILGKIAEKKQKEPAEYLQYYLTATTLLDENNAEYPEKINYSNPQHLSVEALELHYRIHASVLKYLELHEGKDIPNTLGAFFKKCMGMSKFLQKPPPPPPPPPPPAPPLPPEQTAEPPKLETVVPNVAEEVCKTPTTPNTSFQEQFLNSLNKLSSPTTDSKDDKTKQNSDVQKNEDKESGVVVEKPIVNGKTETEAAIEKTESIPVAESTETKVEPDIVKSKTDTEIIETKTIENKTDVENKATAIIAESNDNENDLNNAEDKTTTETKIPAEKTDSNTTMEINTEDDVVMIIYDSEDENKVNLSSKKMEVDEEQPETSNINDIKEGEEKMALTNSKDLDATKEDDGIKDKMEVDEEVERKEDKDTDLKMETEDMSKAKEPSEADENKVNVAESPVSEGSKFGAVKDVQQMLDEMMRETMKETEECGNEVDSDMSGTEKIEEVVVKDDQESMEPKVETKVEIVENKEEPSEKKGNSEAKPKREKRSDTETDNDKKTSAGESSSGSSSSSSSSDSSDSDSDDDDDDSSSSSSSSSSDDNSEFMSQSEISHLIDKCVNGLEICITRLTQNYKALYRLAHLYFHYKLKKDITKSKQLLLSEYKCKDGTVVSGLFNDRKPNNFFHGIWRIPSTEIDRPGSLSAHMSRCLSLLMQILRNTNDNKTLIDLCVQLTKVPDPDKIYIKNSERMAFSEQAMTMCIQSLKSQTKLVPNMTNPQIAKILQEIYKIYQRLMKHVPTKETPFANLLVEVYKQFIKEKIPENVNVLDLAVKFCMQNKSAEKSRQQGISQKTPMFIPRGPGVSTSAPVMPSPQTITPPQGAPLKRPSGSRPRGRPPLQKAPGQPRYQRSKSPSAAANLNKTYSWQKSLMDQTYAIEYIKHYKDELIKQYSKNMSIPQLAQLSQILTQDQLKLLTTLIPKQSTSSAPSTSSSLHTMTSASGIVSTGKQSKQHSSSSSRQHMPSTSMPSTSMAGTSKSSVGESSKHKQSTSTTSSKNITASHTVTQVFKEPSLNKSQSLEEKAAKDLMKDRPNISITPVAVSALPPPPSISPSFIRPTSTSPSSGKTLQEKLAEKKKEQQSKQMKSSGEEEKRQTDALMKTLNITSLPSSLTVSPAQPIPSPSIINMPDTSQAGMFNFPKAPPTIGQKYPLDMGMPSTSSSKTIKDQPLPTALTVSRGSPLSSIGTPSFPVDSGISIRQVAINLSEKSKESPSVKDKNRKSLDLSLGPAVDISPVKKPEVTSYRSESFSKDVEIIPNYSKKSKHPHKKKVKTDENKNITELSINPVASKYVAKQSKEIKIKPETVSNVIEIVDQPSIAPPKHSKGSYKRSTKEKPTEKLKEIKSFIDPSKFEMAKKMKAYYKSESSKKSEKPTPDIQGNVNILSHTSKEGSPKLDTTKKREYPQLNSKSPPVKDIPKSVATSELIMSKSESFQKLESLSRSGLSIVKSASSKKSENIPRVTEPIKRLESQSKPGSSYISPPKKQGFSQSEMSRKLEYLSKSGLHLEKFSKSAKQVEGIQRAGPSRNEDSKPRSELVKPKDQTRPESDMQVTKYVSNKPEIHNKNDSDDDDVICID
ncbi:calcineurin-binding protein cabin-1 isoform X3 [Diabrotica virgifera virgifera]|uniref:Calcineurin-binding protein cabin-1-like n=1 Tax=Diabrotica virgifera virgifera TaxID=50390 RepID=A0ABM5K1H5_DIAVI|nr:calcineurin-binding protein cabin-1 isoform X3 [Diabrotica virgifera virgifera]